MNVLSGFHNILFSRRGAKGYGYEKEFRFPYYPVIPHSVRLSSSDFCVRFCKLGNYINDGLSKELGLSGQQSEWIGNTNTSDEQGGEGESRGSAASKLRGQPLGQPLFYY